MDIPHRPTNISLGLLLNWAARSSKSSGIRPWLRQQAVVPEPERKAFWDKLERKRQKYAEDPDAPAPPSRYKKVLLASLPPGSEEPEIWHRRAGLAALAGPGGSQGRCGAVASWSGRRRPLYHPRGHAWTGRRPHVPVCPLHGDRNGTLSGS